MGIGTASAAIIGGVGAAGAVGSSLIGANAAGNAASTQANAAEEGAQLQYDLGNENLGLQTQIFNTEQANEKPFLEAGQNAVTSINDLMGQKPLSSAPAASQPPIQAPTISNPNGNQAPAYPNGFVPPPGYTGATNTSQPYEFGQPSAIPKAKGGVVQPLYMQARNYLVGEKGPEMLTMFPDGHGWVTPHKNLPPHYLQVASTHRMEGGPVGPGGIQIPPRYQPPSNQGVAGPGGTNGQVPIHQTGTNGTPVNPGGAGNNPNGVPTGAWSGDPNAAQDQNNPLINGGSSTPSQNVPFTNWTQAFTAPTAAQAAATPGEQFIMQQGDQALLDQASAAGTTGSAGTAAALDQYNSNLASTYYQQAYNNQLQDFQQNYNIFENNQANEFNRLASTAGLGQTSAGQLNSAGSTYGANAGNTLLSTGYNIGNELNNAGAAEASGYVGEANAYSGGLSGLANSASLPLYLQMLQQQQNGSYSGGSFDPNSYGLANS